MTPEEAIAFAVFKDNTKKLLIDSVARQELLDRKSTRLNSSHAEISTLSLHDALPIWGIFS